MHGRRGHGQDKEVRCAQHGCNAWCSCAARRASGGRGATPLRPHVAPSVPTWLPGRARARAQPRYAAPTACAHGPEQRSSRAGGARDGRDRAQEAMLAAAPTRAAPLTGLNVSAAAPVAVRRRACRKCRGRPAARGRFPSRQRARVARVEERGRYMPCRCARRCSTHAPCHAHSTRRAAAARCSPLRRRSEGRGRCKKHP